MTKPRVAVIIVGIDGFEKFTLPLVESISKHEPSCSIVIVDNDSNDPYPYLDEDEYSNAFVIETDRLSYAQAINEGKSVIGIADYYIVLSNDVLCTGPFIDKLVSHGNDSLVGPLLKETPIEHVGTVSYLEGWCVAVPRKIWGKLGGWDEGYQISSYEDCDLSHRARKAGYGLIEDRSFPFVHLDQKQRFTIVPDYWDSETHNRARFVQKHGHGR